MRAQPALDAGCAEHSTHCWKSLTQTGAQSRVPALALHSLLSQGFSELGSELEPSLPIVAFPAADSSGLGSLCSACQEGFSSGLICIIISHPFYRAGIDLQGLLAF